MPYLSNCCFGCASLRTGTIAILIGTVIFTGYEVIIAAVTDGLLNKTNEKQQVVKELSELFGIVLVIYFICACIAVFGAVKRRPPFLIPGLVAHAILLVYFIWMALQILPKLSDEKSSSIASGLLIATIIPFLLFGYFGAVMFSFYQQMTGQ